MTQKVHGLRRSRTHLLSLSVSESQELSCGLAAWFWFGDGHEIVVKMLAMAAVVWNTAGAGRASSVLGSLAWLLSGSLRFSDTEAPFSPPLAPWTCTQGLLESPPSLACGFPQSKYSKRTQQKLQCISESCLESHAPSFPQYLSGQPSAVFCLRGDHTRRQGPLVFILAAGYHRWPGLVFLIALG